MSNARTHWAKYLILLALVHDTIQTRSLRARDQGACSWSKYGSPTPLQDGFGTCPTPLDTALSSQQTDRWSPWSFPPYCVKPAKLGDDAPEYCLYTSVTFRGSHGISIIATPDLAASIVGSLDDSQVPDQHKHHPSSFMDPRNGSTLPYDIRDLPGMGKGVVARKGIARWGTVVVDWPVLMLPTDYQRYFTVHQRRALLGRAIQQLPRAQQEAVLALAHATGGELIEDILQTNIFGVELDGASYMGLFPLGSRVNHNCIPNVFWRYAPQTMTMEVVATRDIMPGEEITHTYVALGRTRKERQQTLSQWGFNCSCWLCTASSAQVQASDGRRERVLDIHASLAETYEGESEYVLDEDAIASLAEELVGLVEEEQLWPQLVVFYEVIARAYMEIAEWDSARQYVGLAEERWILYGGEDHDNVDGIRALWAELKQRASAR